MGKSEYEKIKSQMKSSSYIFMINTFLQKFRMGSKKIDKLEENFIKLQKEHDNVQSYTEKYTKYFTQYGFVIYSSIDFSIIKTSVDLYEKGKIKESIYFIQNYYSASQIMERFSIVRNSGINAQRIQFIERILEDYKDEKYYAVIPVLLMMIDGIVADVGEYGIHSQKSELSVWDAFEIENTGLQMIKDIFSKSRKKTTNERISFPYRNGILHGRDLGYDTKEVAILSWVYLFAVIDFIRNKKSENDRKIKYEQNTKISFLEHYSNLKDLRRQKKDILKWKARAISNEYIQDINMNCTENNKPECIVVKYLNYLKKSNYGNMVKNEYRIDKITEDNYGKFAKKIRERFSEIKLERFKILNIADIAPAITIIKVELELIYYGELQIKEVELRCIIESKRKVTIHGDKNGVWKIVPLNI